MRRIYCLVVLVALLATLATAKSYPKLNVRSSNNGVECALCEFVAEELFNWMSANTTAPEIENFLDKLCEKLPFPGNYECEWLVKEIVHVIPIIVYNIPRQDIHPIDVCGLVKRCDIDCCSSGLPEQVRLSGESDVTVMFVAWVQASNNTGSVVQYGTTSGSLTMSSSAHVHTYYSGNWKGYIYNATLVGLSENTQYRYRVGSVAGGWSQEFGFKTFVNSGFDSTTSTWAVIGDMGTNEESDATVARLKELVSTQQVVGILHNGDLAYADGVQRRWDEFGRKVQAITANIQYQTVPGNHEMAIVTYLGLEGYKNRWFMPYDFPLARPGGQDAFWYSFTRGPLRVIGLNSESHLDISLISQAQLDWLKQAMLEAQRTRDRHPWLVVMLHRPLYCSSSRHSDCGTFASWLREWLEQTFHDNKVDMVITAHMHSYERTLPLFNGTPYPGYNNALAPVYVVNGAAGCREGLSGFEDQAPNWSAIRVKDFGYATLTVSKQSLTWKWYSSKDNILHDTMVLTKN